MPDIGHLMEQEDCSFIGLKFFVPFAENDQQESQLYQSIKNFVAKTAGIIEFDQRKICFLSFQKEQKNIKAEVGQYNDLNGETVIAILYEPLHQNYHVCTPSSGVVRGKSIVVPERNVIEMQEFCPEN